jgi:hypothetical protein
MDHSAIISLNPRNMITIVVMVTIGWFFLHLIGNLVNGTFTSNSSVSLGPDGSGLSGGWSGSLGTDTWGGM